jgi:hypothetical protein
MREMNPDSVKSDARLAGALRAMAAAAPAEAPRELGDALSKAFRRHHARRRTVRRSAIALAILLALFSAGRLLVLKPLAPASVKSPAISPVGVPPQATTGTAVRPSASSATPGATPGVRHLKSKRQPAASPRDFVALASFDQAARDEDLRVVRLELTGRALRLAGAPVSEEMADRRVLADFVVGQDGTPYAVRLVPRRHSLE